MIITWTRRVLASHARARRRSEVRRRRREANDLADRLEAEAHAEAAARWTRGDVADLFLGWQLPEALVLTITLSPHNSDIALHMASLVTGKIVVVDVHASPKNLRLNNWPRRASELKAFLVEEVSVDPRPSLFEVPASLN